MPNNGGRNHAFTTGDPELAVRIWMLSPLAFHFKTSLGNRRRQSPHNRYRIGLPAHHDLGNGKPVLRIAECDSFDLAGKVRQRMLCVRPAPIPGPE